jgi:hypothetical protein
MMKKRENVLIAVLPEQKAHCQNRKNTARTEKHTARTVKNTSRTERTLPEQKEHCQNRNNTVPSDGHESLIHARIQFGRSLIKFYRKLICQCLSLLKWYFLKVAKVVIM